MVTSTLAEISQKFSHYKRQTYLFAFPLGIAICIMYIFGTHGSWGLKMYVGVVMVLELVAFVFLLIFYPRFMPVIEKIFYFSFSIFFLILTWLTIETFRLDNGLDQNELGNVLNSLSMWMIVFMLGAYLTTSKKYIQTLIVSIFVGVIVLAVGNLWVTSTSQTIGFGLIFSWVNAIASLSVATLLFQRMGVLQQSYASTDSLTSLLNRRSLYQILSIEVERSTRYQNPFSIVLFDVDHFKKINDTHGHLAGDEILRKISEQISRSIRLLDYAGRWGGEEFLLILPETDGESAQILAERVCQSVKEIQYGKVDVTLSSGIACFQKGQNLEDLLHCADRALYQAKQNGRNQVVLYSTHIDG
ncbi:MAG: GGDEF domain-containing protein [Anaerolineales bacterium]